jgi:diguanylate cyclase (GGDEF)-like protein
LAYFDLDDFKGVNDRYGHAEGDRLLSALGQVLRHARSGDLAARLGGDEFALLMPETDELAAAAAVARIRGVASLALSRDGFRVSFSSGVATFDEVPLRVDELLRVADKQLGDAERQRRPKARTGGRAIAKTPLGDLVSDLRDLYEPRPGALAHFERVTLASMVAELLTLDHDRWTRAFHGQPLTARRLSRMLAKLGIAPRRLREVDAHSRAASRVSGYLLADLTPLFSRPPSLKLEGVADGQSDESDWTPAAQPS